MICLNLCYYAGYSYGHLWRIGERLSGLMLGAVSRGDRGDVDVGIGVDIDAQGVESVAKIDDARPPRRIDDDVAQVSSVALELGSRLCGEFGATRASLRLGGALFEENARFALALFL